MQIAKFEGAMEHTLRAEVAVLSTTRAEKKPWVRPPISMQFSVGGGGGGGVRARTHAQRVRAARRWHPAGVRALP